jgi:hypothetical protein
MNKHTAGPWKLEKYMIQDKNDNDIAEIQRYGVVAANTDEMWSHSTHWKANARLIAAAPDMLEALKWADKFYQDNFDVMPVAWQGVADAIEAAIQKAEGLNHAD